MAEFWVLVGWLIGMCFHWAAIFFALCNIHYELCVCACVRVCRSSLVKTETPC